MADNTTDVSRDSFQFAKFYDSVRLQDGVPIMDSDWNEMDDMRRVNDMLTLVYGFGRNLQFLDDSSYAGFEPHGNNQNNDFPLRGGVALVEGVLIMTSADDPPVTFDYDSTANIYCDNGIVTGVAGGIITDSYKYWTRLGAVGDALVPSAYQGGARVRMTSGVENGNTFTVSAVPNSTSLTLSGGTGSIAVDDTYIVLPPALTTPGGSRTDEIFLMVWWEDIAGDEDDGTTPLIHPAIMIESCHRLQRKWVVRVTEGGTTPSTVGSIHAFGTRYLKIGKMARTASAVITSAMVTPETDLHVANYSAHTIDGTGHGISGEYTSATLTAANSGGIGTGLSTFEDIFDAVDEGLIRRRAFTAVITDDTSSTGGDFDSSTAIDNISVNGSAGLSEGTFFVRRGTYDWSISGMGTGDYTGKVIGESRDSVHLRIPSGASADFSLAGMFDNISLETQHASYRYIINSLGYGNTVVIDNSSIAAGTMYWDRGKTIIRNSIFTTNSLSTNNYGIEISQTSFGDFEYHEGVIENCYFYGISSAASTEYDTIFINNISAGSYNNIRGITFRDCTVVQQPTQRNALRITNCEEVPLVFDGCSFYNGSTVTNTPILYLEDNTKIIFKNCLFDSRGPLFDIRNTGVTFENCTFVENTSTSYSAQIAVCEGGYDIDNPAVFNNCTLTLNGGGFSATSSMPAIEFGGRGGKCYCDAILVDGLTIVFDSSEDIPRFTPVVLWGTGNYGGRAIYNNVTIDCNTAETSFDRDVYGIEGVASILEIVGINGASRVVGKNIQVVKLNNPSNGVSDSSTVVTLYNAEVEGLEIDGTGTNTGNFGASPYGLIYLEEVVILKNLRMFPTYEILSDGGGSVVVINDSSSIDGGLCYSGITNAISNFFMMPGNDCSVSNFLGVFTTGDQTFYVFRILGLRNTVSHNTIRVGDRSAGLYYTIGTSSSATLTRILDNSIVLTDIYASPNEDVILCTGDGNLVDGNSLANVGTTVPTIINNGTGSITGDNVAIANYA